MTGLLSGTGSWTQGPGSTLNNSLVAGAVISVTTFDAGTNANTVNYNGAAQTVRAVTYSALTLSTSGIKTLTGLLLLIKVPLFGEMILRRSPVITI